MYITYWGMVKNETKLIWIKLLPIFLKHWFVPLVIAEEHMARTIYSHTAAGVDLTNYQFLNL
jgi:hypothetical protein